MRVAVLVAVVAAVGVLGGGAGSASPPQDEFDPPIAVTARLSQAPAVGQRERLTTTVRADRQYARATIDVEIPPILRFVDRPQGARLVRTRSSDGTYIATVARLERRLPVGRVVRLTASIAAAAPGPAQIRVRVRAAVRGGVDAGVDNVFLTVGRHRSHFGIDVPPVGGVTGRG